MATYTSYTPTGVIGRALFNFDEFGVTNYKLTGTVRVSVSDSFSSADYQSFHFYSDLYTAGSNEVVWTSQMLGNIQDVLGIYSQFANITFEWKGDYDASPPGSDATPNSRDVGQANLTDININWITRSDIDFAGISGGGSDNALDYIGAAGDIFLNRDAFADYTLDLNTRARQTLEHELGHSLGLAHPHSAYNDGVPTITAEYAATKDLGFNQLGFRTATAGDMYKEYFTIMSYDDQQSVLPGSSAVFHAHTPMILDVIALQEAYGEGAGTTGPGNDVITAGTAGYRTYFDKSGTDTIDLSLYDAGVYLQMGVSIVGAAHLVGVSMSVSDASKLGVPGGDPADLRLPGCSRFRIASRTRLAAPVPTSFSAIRWTTRSTDWPAMIASTERAAVTSCPARKGTISFTAGMALTRFSEARATTCCMPAAVSGRTP